MPSYSFDSSSLVAAWIERYPLKNFPGFWENLDELIHSGEAVASREVLRELKRRDESLHEWCKARGQMFVEVDDTCQDHVISIMAKYPRFVDTRTGKNSGDPFVIALAASRNPSLTVISEENGGATNRPAIPFVCGVEGLECIKLVELIQKLDWRFKR